MNHSSENKDIRARLKIDSALYVHIENEESARGTWDSLENAFEEKGLVRQVGLLHKLLRLTLESNQLRNADFTIPDRWVGILLLPNSGVAITGDFVKTKLLQEEEGFYGNDNNSQAFATNKQPGRQGRQKKAAAYFVEGPKMQEVSKTWPHR